MGASKIEWTERTWNPIVGCSIVSPGCIRCYAMRDAWRKHHNPKLPHYHGLTKKVNGHPVWTGVVRRAPEHILLEPLRTRKPAMWFVNSMSDLFHESIPDDDIDDVFAVMAMSPEHTFQALTKRPERMRAYLADRLSHNEIELAAEKLRPTKGKPFSPKHVLPWPLPNVWLGTSVEDQTRADERRASLQVVAAGGWTTFVSYEPAIGGVDWSGWEFLRWLISGGESGAGARPTHPDWHRAARDSCARNGIAYFFKQWGAWLPGQNDPHPLQKRGVAHWQDGGWGARETKNPEQNYVMWGPDGRLHRGGSRSPKHYFEVQAWAARVGKKAAGRTLDGRTWDGFPVLAQPQRSAA